MMKITNLPDWIRYIAQDADGQWWGYEVEPNLSDISWYENEVGKFIQLHKEAPVKDWQNTIIRISR